MTATGDVIWEAVGLVADRVEADSALPATRGAVTKALRNILKSGIRPEVWYMGCRIEVVDVF